MEYLMPDQFGAAVSALIERVPCNFVNQAVNQAVSIFEESGAEILTEDEIIEVKDRMLDKIKDLDNLLVDLTNNTPFDKDFDEARGILAKINAAVNRLSNEVSDLDV